MARYLVIVESPTKVKTIKKFLGSNYVVVASNGHVRDLPKSQLGVGPENDYEPKYITIRGKGEILANLRKEVKKADKVYLATDPDREGEAISWHLMKALKLEGKKVYRISFNEITKSAVKASLKNARDIDMDLVDAQQARRVLDRIVGYKISPVLWAKVKRGLSAGRVQSVALRIIADREDEIAAFIPEEYWSLDANFKVKGEKKPLTAKFYGTKDERMEYFNSNVKDLTTLVQTGIQDYVYLETSNFVTVQTELNRNNRNSTILAVGVAIVAMSISLLLSGRAARSVTRPIRDLCDLTEKVAGGDFSVKTQVEAGDEIAVLTRSFNDMTEEIGILVDDIRKKQENLRIIENRLLQEQINPHFLYNTLDAIVWLAEENKSAEVVKMVTSLSDFFRTTLSKGHDYITVKEERTHIESYLEIQQFRYQDILDYEIQMDEEIYGYIIPKLTLQPLVENALYHGIKNKRGKGKILITGKKQGDKIIF